jgi:hypothetical protein
MGHSKIATTKNIYGHLFAQDRARFGRLPWEVAIYQPYPPASGLPQQPPRIQPPRSVLTAVKLMYAGAALSALLLVITLVTIGSLKAAIVARHPGYTAAQLHAAEIAGVAGAVVGGLIEIGQWLWMAWANGRGARLGQGPVCGVLRHQHPDADHLPLPPG